MPNTRMLGKMKINPAISLLIVIAYARGLGIPHATMPTLLAIVSILLARILLTGLLAPC